MRGHSGDAEFPPGGARIDKSCYVAQFNALREL
jgi:hypothetical protein